jgi:hypothetical protein
LATIASDGNTNQAARDSRRICRLRKGGKLLQQRRQQQQQQQQQQLVAQEKWMIPEGKDFFPYVRKWIYS